MFFLSIEKNFFVKDRYVDFVSPLGPNLGQKWEKSGYFWDFHPNSSIFMSQNCSIFEIKLELKLCSKKSNYGDFEPKFRAYLGQNSYKSSYF